jgi:hypothetical protein
MIHTRIVKWAHEQLSHTTSRRAWMYKVWVYMTAHKVYVGATIKNMPLEGHHCGCREPSSFDHIKQRSSSTKHIFSTPCPGTYTWENKETRVLDPEGLASIYLGTQDLVTCLKEALNLSCGLAWYKCWFKWIFETSLEAFLKRIAREEEWVVPREKRQTSPKVLWEEPIEASWEACRGPTQDALEACPW